MVLVKTHYQNKNECEIKAANIISISIKEIVKQKGKCIFAIPGGRSVSGIFNILKDKDVNWKKVHIFMVDERLVPLTDLASNFKLAKDTFLDYLVSQGKLPVENLHPFEFEKGIQEYESDLRENGGTYDIILLSSGEDGHVGGLFPNHHSIEDESSDFIIMNDSPKPPPKRMTLTKSLLIKSQVAIVLFLGEDKRDAFLKFQDKNVSISQCPTKLVNKVKNSYVITNTKSF
jgi:6-phosphogluconolactonase